MLIDLPTAKLHLRVDSTDEDTLITIWIGTAEQQAVEFLNRNVYEDQAALDAAVLAAPAALTAATAAYDAAITAADALEDEVEQEMATQVAEYAYIEAQKSARMAQFGVVVNDQIKAAILLTVGHLYASREDVVVGVSVAKLPNGAERLLHPYRVGMGV